MVAPAVLAAGAQGASNALAAGFDYMAAGQATEQSAENARWNLAQRQAEFNKNVEMQYEFAKNGISWRIEDAARHGISPLAAIGASGTGFSPVVGVGGSEAVGAGDKMRAIGSGFRDVGQSVSRALLATKSKEEKAAEVLELARRAKENDLLDLQIRNAQLKLSGIGDPGIPDAYQRVRNLDGTISIIPSEIAARSAHAEMFGSTLWSAHNGLIPQVQGVGKSDWIPWDVRGERMLPARSGERNLP